MRITPARDFGTSRNFLVVANSHVPALELVLERYKTFWENCDQLRFVVYMLVMKLPGPQRCNSQSL